MTPIHGCTVSSILNKDTSHSNCLPNGKGEAISLDDAQIPGHFSSRPGIELMRLILTLQTRPVPIRHESDIFVYHTFRSCIQGPVWSIVSVYGCLHYSNSLRCAEFTKLLIYQGKYPL